MPTTDFFAKVSYPCPHEPGTRIRLLRMSNDPDPVPPGSTGTVTGGNGSQLWVDWDNGRTLMVLVGEDHYDVIN